MNLFKDLYYLFFPELCIACNSHLVKNEQLICLKCRLDLPFTESSGRKDNVIEKTFYGRVKIDFGTALFFYESKGVAQQIIHQLKYKNQEKVGELLGDWLGSELKNTERLPKIDYVIPVPIHKKKLKTRGYNQNTLFGKQIAHHLDCNFNETILIAKQTKETQTKKSRVDRFKNVAESFEITDTTLLKNKKVLLVDDVITTGATLEACILQLQKIGGINISIATMAFTS